MVNAREYVFTWAKGQIIQPLEIRHDTRSRLKAQMGTRLKAIDIARHVGTSAGVILSYIAGSDIPGYIEKRIEEWLKD
jgi:hypothetical protein